VLYQPLSDFIGRYPLTHIRAFDFRTTFFQAVLNILLFVALVVPQPPNEVVKRFFEPSEPVLASVV
jgi:hypothetical protein